jgi:hypothetical protein
MAGDQRGQFLARPVAHILVIRRFP